MTGGLIQLITTGVQDAPLIGNPEITFFKKVYKRHTLFTIWQNDRYLGNIPFNKRGNKVIEKNGDLLYSTCLKLDIPYFEIVKTVATSNVIDTGYNVNQLDVTYGDVNSIVLYLNGYWYVVPENLFMLSSFSDMIAEIDATLLQPNLLPEFIDINNLKSSVYYNTIMDDTIYPLRSILRVNSSYWEQLWLGLTDSSDNLLSLKGYYKELYSTLKNRIYNLYQPYNFLSVNTNYFNFQYTIMDLSGNYLGINETETERYFEYKYMETDVPKLLTSFDMDVAYNYCINNKLNFNNYIDSTITINSLIISLLLNMLFSDGNLYFTFWKDYTVNVDNGNTIDFNSSNNITNSESEWALRFNDYISLFTNISKPNLILDQFRSLYAQCETQINSLYNTLNFSDPILLYIKLKTILERFVLIPNQQVNFNNNYMATK